MLNIFIGAVVGGGIFQQLGTYLAQPSRLFSQIGTALPTTANFFIQVSEEA